MVGCFWEYHIDTPYGKIKGPTSNRILSKKEALKSVKKTYINAEKVTKNILLKEAKIAEEFQQNEKLYEEAHNELFKFMINKEEIMDKKIIPSYVRTIYHYNHLFKFETLKNIILNENTNPNFIKAIKKGKESNYKKIVSSFYNSKEWKKFRASWLKFYPDCYVCGKKCDENQVHHMYGYNLYQTILYEGFLEGLNHPERFLTLCNMCHARVGGYSSMNISQINKNKIKKLMDRPKIMRSNNLFKQIKQYFWILLMDNMKSSHILVDTENLFDSLLIEGLKDYPNTSYNIEIQNKFTKIQFWMHDLDRSKNKYIFDNIHNSKRKFIEKFKEDVIFRRLDHYRLSVIEIYVSRNFGWNSKYKEMNKLQEEIIKKFKKFEKVINTHYKIGR